MLPKDFVSGVQEYLDALPFRAEPTTRIVLSVLVEETEIATLLDTGATQCVLEWDVGEPLLSQSEDAVPVERALGGGVHRGFAFPVAITFPADEGDPVSIGSIAWTAETFHGPNLVGYGGLLEKMRFALEPAENRFYFGA
jgi:hypothetical protein